MVVVVDEGAAYRIILERCCEICDEMWNVKLIRVVFSSFLHLILGGEVVAEEDEGEEDGKEAPPTLARFLTTWFHAQ